MASAPSAAARTATTPPGAGSAGAGDGALAGRGIAGRHLVSEGETWLAAQPKLANGKVDGRLLVAESKRRGYCVCPKPMRQMINFDGTTCYWCDQLETRQSWSFWYGGTS